MFEYHPRQFCYPKVSARWGKLGPEKMEWEHLGFPGGSVGKESICNAGDSGLIPGSGRSPGEEISYPFQYSWAFLVAQLVKNPPAMQETCVWPLDWDDPLEKEKATHSSILAWRIPWTVQYSPRGCKESGTTERLPLSHQREKYYQNDQICHNGYISGSIWKDCILII